MKSDFFKRMFGKPYTFHNDAIGLDIEIDAIRIGKALDYAQDALDSQMWDLMKLYMPIDTGSLIQQTQALNESVSGEVYCYDPSIPYGHYQYEGKLYEDPVYHVGAFYSPSYGFWSRPGVKKVRTEWGLEYHGNPDTQPHWGEFVINNHSEELRKVVENTIRANIK